MHRRLLYYDSLIFNRMFIDARMIYIATAQEQHTEQTQKNEKANIMYLHSGRCLYARLRNTPTAARYRAEVARILGMVRMRRLADYF